MLVESESDFSAYRGFNPSFAEKVWAKRREENAHEISERKRQMMVAQIDRDMPSWVKDIIVTTCDKHGVGICEVMSKDTRAHVGACRGEIFCLIYESEFRPSFPRIGLWFGRGHSAVLQAVQRHKRSLAQAA